MTHAIHHRKPGRPSVYRRDRRPTAVSQRAIDVALSDAPADVELFIELGAQGMRALDIAGLDLADLEQCAYELPPATAVKIRRYLADHQDGPLFPLPRLGTPMSANRISRAVRLQFVRHGLNIHLFDLRHSYLRGLVQR